MAMSWDSKREEYPSCFIEWWESDYGPIEDFDTDDDDEVDEYKLRRYMAWLGWESQLERMRNWRGALEGVDMARVVFDARHRRVAAKHGFRLTDDKLATLWSAEPDYRIENERQDAEAAVDYVIRKLANDDVEVDMRGSILTPEMIQEAMDSMIGKAHFREPSVRAVAPDDPVLRTLHVGPKGEP